MLAGVGVYFIPNPSFPSNLSAAMRRNSRDTMPNTLESILMVSGLGSTRAVILRIPTCEQMNLVSVRDRLAW